MKFYIVEPMILIFKTNFGIVGEFPFGIFFDEELLSILESISLFLILHFIENDQ